MAIITLAQIKTQLGISDSSQDAAITAKLPIIDAKVKAITNRNWNDRIVGNITNASTYIEVFSYGTQNPSSPYYYDDLIDYVMVGQQITGDGMPSDAYITDIWAKGTASNDSYPQIQIDQNATQTKSGADLFLGFPITYHDIVAKGVQWLINQTSTTINDTNWSSRGVGPLSVSKNAANNSIDGIHGMPAWFVKGLPRYHR